MTQSRTVRQFCRFSVVGFSGFCIDFGVYYALTRGFAFWRTFYLAAKAVSFVCAVTNNLIWHKRWTFRDQATHVPERDPCAKAPAGPSDLGSQFATFLAVSVVGLLLNSLILYVVSHQAPVRAAFGDKADLFAIVVATGVVWFWNFGANKLWTFRRG